MSPRFVPLALRAASALLVSLWLLGFAAAPGWAQGQVRVVDANGGPGSHFTSLQAAVDASQAGDVLLMRSGRYEPLVLVGKPLTIAADRGEVVEIGAIGGGPSLVRSVPKGQRVVLRDLRFEANWNGQHAPGVTLSLLNSPGLVWLQNCTIRDGSPSLVARNCGELVLSGLDVSGQKEFGGGHAALLIENSIAVVHQGSYRGSKGRDAALLGDPTRGPVTPLPALPGGTGVGLLGGVVEWIGGSMLGGAGGAGIEAEGNCLPPAIGGTGLAVDGGALVRVRQPFADGGGAGLGVPCAPEAQDGQPLKVVVGSFQPLPGLPTMIESPSPFRVGETIRITVYGEPGQFAFLKFSPFPGMLDLGVIGTLLVSPFGIEQPLGILPPNGQLAFTATLQAVASNGFLQRFVHSGLCNVGLGVCGLGAATTVLALDAAF